MKTVLKIIELAGGLEWIKQGGNYIRIEHTSKAILRLVIEYIGPGPNGRPCISVAHYGEQNGDAMRDPEMTFEISETMIARGMMDDCLLPISYRNDYAGVCQEGEAGAVYFDHADGKLKHRPRLVLELRRFAKMWDKNIREQGFLEIFLKQLRGKQQPGVKDSFTPEQKAKERWEMTRAEVMSAKPPQNEFQSPNPWYPPATRKNVIKAVRKTFGDWKELSFNDPSLSKEITALAIKIGYRKTDRRWIDDRDFLHKVFTDTGLKERSNQETSQGRWIPANTNDPALLKSINDILKPVELLPEDTALMDFEKAASVYGELESETAEVISNPAEVQRLYRATLENAVSKKQPVNAYGWTTDLRNKLPEGYVREGDLYVHKPEQKTEEREASEQPTPAKSESDDWFAWEQETETTTTAAATTAAGH